MEMRILGFRAIRYVEWWRVLKGEGRRLTVGDWYGLVKLALKGLIKKKEKGVETKKKKAQHKEKTKKSKRSRKKKKSGKTR